MKRLLILAVSIFSVCAGQCFADSLNTENSASSTTRTVIVIPVSGDVEPAMAAHIARAFRENSSRPNPLFLLEMDTFGGRVDAALMISDTIMNAASGETVAFVKNKAISAGALIALSCNRLVMKHNTTIGDCAPLMMSQEGPQMLGEKFQSPLRAQFRTMARKNNYPQALAESMVTQGMTVYKAVFSDTTVYIDSIEIAELTADRKSMLQSKKTVVSSNELLTMDDVEAHDFGFSKMSVESIEEMLELMNITDYEIIRQEETWSETFVRFITKIAPILMMIGFAALYTEMKTPGIGLPGILGVICLGLVFAGQYLVGLANYTELLIIALGAALLAVELFVTPGFGATGIAGLLLMAIGMILSFQGFVLPRPEFPWEQAILGRNIITVAASLTGSMVLILLFFSFVLPKMSRIAPGPYLSATLAQSHIEADGAPAVTSGARGTVIKPLRPSGTVKINERIFDVVAEGEFIEAGKQISVLEVSGNRIVVTEVKENAA